MGRTSLLFSGAGKREEGEGEDGIRLFQMCAIVWSDECLMEYRLMGVGLN